MAGLITNKLKNTTSYTVTYYVEGTRRRETFDTKTKALHFKRQIENNEIDLLIDDEGVTLAQAIRNYFEVESQKKASAKNEKAWLTDFYNFLSHPERADGSRSDLKPVHSLSDISLMHLRSFQDYLKTKREIQNTTVNRRFATYKHFFKFCLENKYISESPTQFLKGLKDDSKSRYIPTPSELMIVIQEIKPLFRNYLMVQAEIGARPNELLDLTYEDLNLEAGLIRLASKKGKGEIRYRILPLPERAKEILTAVKAQAQRSFKAKAKDYVFSFNGSRLRQELIPKHIKRICKKNNINSFCPYALRHLFCSDLSKLGKSVFDVQKLMGHSNIRTTQKYYHSNFEHLKNVMNDATKVRDLFKTGGSEG